MKTLIPILIIASLLFGLAVPLVGRMRRRGGDLEPPLAPPKLDRAKVESPTKPAPPAAPPKVERPATPPTAPPIAEPEVVEPESSNPRSSNPRSSNPRSSNPRSSSRLSSEPMSTTSRHCPTGHDFVTGSDGPAPRSRRLLACVAALGSTRAPGTISKNRCSWRTWACTAPRSYSLG